MNIQQHHELYKLKQINSQLAIIVVKTKTKIYDATEENSMQTMIEIAQSTLKALGMDVRTQFLDKTLVEIIGEINKKKNIVTLYHEENKIYIKFKEESEEAEPFWSKFEGNLQVFGGSTEKLEEKTKVVKEIMNCVLETGYNISDDDCWDFLLNFEQQYKKLPSKEQIRSIALSYAKMCQEQGIKPGDTTENSVFIGDEPQNEEEYKVTPTEALKEIILEMNTLTPEDKKFFISLFNDLTVEDQKKLVIRIKAIESDLDKIPYLKMEERADIRKEVMNLSTEKRRAHILKIINKRKKNLQQYAHAAMEDDLKEALNKMPFLSDLEKEVHLGRMSELNVEDKKKYLKRLRDIEDSLEKLIQQGIELSEIDKRGYRDELLRLGKDEREKRISEILEEKKYETVEKELIDEIPSLKFEEHEKTVKQLMWLSLEERKSKIKNMKVQFNDETTKKTKVFEESKVGSTCPSCGWPIGALSKKCPRCGKQLGFSLDI